MFSLIITIISIALVAALALATLYYGGGVFSKGSADASAAKVILQGQQLLGASELYKAEKGAWPASMAELISSNYLKAIPVGLGPMGQALALDRAWEMPSSGRPVFVLHEVDSAVCQSVNKKTYGMDAVLKTARTEYLSQCFGTSTTALKVVMGKTVGDLNYVAADPLAAGVLGVVSALPAPSDRASAEWLDLSGAGDSVVYSFNSCNKIGSDGPTLGECNSAYSGTTLAGLVSITGGIQYWTVPATGTYTAALAGAAGGLATSNSPLTKGRGAVLTTKLSLVQGTTLRILVGQPGTSGVYDGGGGGGTYVVSGSAALAVAGGGGGAGGSGGNAYDASTTTSATANHGYSGGGGWGGGGSGFSDQGVNDSAYGGQSYSYLSGGNGGGVLANGCGSNYQAAGGFGGGGGGGCSGGGGGGGYSRNGGGGAGGNTYYTGTFVSSTATNSGAGYVTFTLN